MYFQSFHNYYNYIIESSNIRVSRKNEKSNDEKLVSEICETSLKLSKNLTDKNVDSVNNNKSTKLSKTGVSYDNEKHDRREKLTPECTNNNGSFSTLNEIIAKRTDNCECYTCPAHNNTNGSYIQSFHQYILIFYSAL